MSSYDNGPGFGGCDPFTYRSHPFRFDRHAAPDAIYDLADGEAPPRESALGFDGRTALPARTAISPLDAPASPAPIWELTNYLVSGYWRDSANTNPRWFDLGPNGNAGVLLYNIQGSTVDADGLTADRQALVREAFQLYSAVLGIRFVETTASTNDVDFYFTDATADKAFARTTLMQGIGGPIDYNVINVAANWYGGISNVGGSTGYTFQTFLHEIGHGLGLGHQGNYNEVANFETDAIWSNDRWQMSMMSYFAQDGIDASYAQLISPMAVDWNALDVLYRYANQGYSTANAFLGDTVYGFGTNISSATSATYANLETYATSNAFCIVDGGGYDLVNFSGFSSGQIINLNPASGDSTTGTVSNVGGLRGNMTIAIGTIIESAYGGSGNDEIYGNDVSNYLVGNDGNDYMYGYGGDDYMFGGRGNDTIVGGGGNDNVFGGDGDDIMLWGRPFPTRRMCGISTGRPATTGSGASTSISAR